MRPQLPASRRNSLPRSFDTNCIAVSILRDGCAFARIACCLMTKPHERCWLVFRFDGQRSQTIRVQASADFTLSDRTASGDGIFSYRSIDTIDLDGIDNPIFVGRFKNRGRMVAVRPPRAKATATLSRRPVVTIFSNMRARPALRYRVRRASSPISTCSGPSPPGLGSRRMTNSRASRAVQNSNSASRSLPERRHTIIDTMTAPEKPRSVTAVSRRPSPSRSA